MTRIKRMFIFKWADLALHGLTVIIAALFIIRSEHFQVPSDPPRYDYSELLLIIPALVLYQLFSCLVNLIAFPRLNPYKKLPFLAISLLIVLFAYVIAWVVRDGIFFIGAALNIWYLSITVFEIVMLRKQIANSDTGII